MVRSLLTILLILFFTSANAQEKVVHLDDVMSPDEILAEIQSEETSVVPTEKKPLNATELKAPMGFWDFLKPRPPEPPPKEWNAVLPEESVQSYGINWFQEYDLVIVINKARTGPTAQRAVVYYKGHKHGTFVVSTGRERGENAKSGKQYFSSTPTGWFSPTRLVRHHFSQTWEAKMDYSVFFNGGIATHAALPPYFKDLGQRASGGCVRLLPDQALWIFEAVKASGKGLVPQFSRTGEPVFDKNGEIKRIENWKSLFIVVNREGR